MQATQNHAAALKTARRTPGFSLSDPDFSVTFFSSMKEVSEDWELVDVPENLFLSRPYLEAVEAAPPAEMGFCYLIFYQHNRPVGKAYGQVLLFNGDTLQNSEGEKEDRNPCFFRAFGRFMKGLFTSRAEFRTLIGGNQLLTGEHAFQFESDFSSEKVWKLVDEGYEIAGQELDRRKLPIDVFFYKDFPESKKPATKIWMDKGFNELPFMPSMVFPIRGHWNTFEDYMTDLTSKCRVRTRRAFKKKDGLMMLEMTLDDLLIHRNKMYDLYKKVAENAGFNAVQLHVDYFVELKRFLPEAFRIYGYFLDGKLRGFFTTILNGEELEAHFLGFESEDNRKFQIYLNMLLDMIRLGIDQQLERIVFARTAMEIKSSVGAVPEEMSSYLRHRSTFANRFLKPLIEYLSPEDAWTPRHPFKKTETVEV